MDWLKKKNKKKKKEEEKQRLVRGRARGAMLLEDIIECCDGKSNPIKFFSADQILKATNNFCYSNPIKSGYLHRWYSGKIDNHPMGHLDRWYSGKIDYHPMIFFRHHKESYFCRDITISSMVSGHKNFMKLLGCCLEYEKPVIVYDFIRMFYLNLEVVVSWKRRIKIAEDIATAIAYLHTAFPRPFVYRTMCLRNIFLDEDGVARLCDFSRCISIPQGKTFVQVEEIPKGETFVPVDTVGGVLDFMDENYKRTSRVSEKTDVFAIGILMQQLLTGEQKYHEFCKEHQEETRREDGDSKIILSDMNLPRRSVPRWLPKSTEERRMDEIADPKMLEKMDEVGEEDFCQMKVFLMLSMRCIGLKREVPNMVEVAKELKNIQRSMKNASASSSSGETKVDSAQDISSSVL